MRPRAARELRAGPVAVMAMALAACAGGGAPTEPAAADRLPPPDPSWSAHFTEARELWRRGDLHGALGQATRALVAAPSQPEPWETVSQLYVELGDDRSAVEFFDIAARKFPGYAPPRFWRGFHEFRLNDWDASLESFRRARELDPGDARNAFREGLVLQATGDFDGAVAALREARALDPGDATVAARLSRALRITGEYDEAERVVVDALAGSSDSSDLHYALGQIRLRQGRIEDAETALRRAIALNPLRADAHDDLARVLARAGREREAAREQLRAERLRDYVDTRSSLLRVLAMRPEDPEVILALAELDLAERNPGGADRWIDLAERIGESGPRLRAARVHRALLGGDVAAAQSEAGGLAGSKDARAGLALAAVALATGKADDALVRLRAAVERGPADPCFYRQAADLYERAGRADDYERLLHTARATPHPLAGEGAEG